MTKLFKNSKQILAFVFAFAVLAVSLFTGGSIDITAEACDTSKVVYWNGTKASSFAGGTGTEADPYIIKTAEQLAFACLGQTPASSTGKYYKVDDSVKIFVLQPQNVVDLDTLLNLESAQATKDYLTGLSGVKNWQTQFSRSSFNGHFDGNGATIYGLYADTVAANMDDCGLFPQFDGGSKNPDGSINPTECKNITVKNSYYKSKRRLGAITGAAYGTNYGAKVDGKVIVDTVAVINCYLEGNAQSIPHYQEEGIVVGGGNLDVIEINNALVKGTYAYDTVQGKRMSVIGASSNAKIPDPANPTQTIYQTKITNSVFLGVLPYRGDHFTSELCEPHIFSNVVTDQASGEVTMTNPAGWGTATTKKDFTGYITQVTSTGFDFQKDSAEVLDWENTWFMSENGPELRKFHGEIKLTQTATTHVWECADCGLTSPGGVADHNWVSEDGQAYSCSVCGYNCKHDSLNSYHSEGDCVVDPGDYTECNYCDYVGVFKTGDAPGHDLTHVKADPGHCEADGHAEYWECSVCNNKFTTDDVKAPMDTAVTDADLNTGLGTHLKKEDENGVIVEYNANGHWYICEIDGGKIDFDCGALDADEVIAHEFSNAKCIECDYECVNHQFKETGKFAVIGDCFTDEEAEVKCELCGYKSSVVTKEAGHSIIKVEAEQPTDKMEGTKEHYKCEVCMSIYGDAEGKTAVTKASLIIRKTLPAGYDQGVTSPATRDNVVAVMAVAALAGAAFVIARKVKAD